MILPNIPDEMETKKKSKVVYDCNKCGLLGKPLPIYGNQESGLVFLGEAPGAEEVVQGIPFIGKSGQYLRSTIRRLGKIKLEKDAATINACSCRPPGNKISDTYLRCCRSKLIENLNQLKPKLVIALGESAINSIMDLLGSKESIGKMRNRLIPCHEFNCMIYATFHPAYVLRKDGTTDNNLSYAFERDIKKILQLWEDKLHSRPNIKLLLKQRNLAEGIKINQIKTQDQLLTVVDKIYDYGKFAFDYEASNLKPFDSYFKIASLCFAIEKDAYVVYLPEYEGKINKLKQIVVEDLLNNPDILTIIQNAKYEELCTRYWIKNNDFDIERSESGQVIRNTFDTMLATHTVDERRGCTSLDFQNLVRFGMKPYNDKVKKYLAAGKDEKQNKVFECNPQDLIYYTGMDGISTYANWKVLDGKLLNEGKFRECYQSLLEGHEAFANMTETGIPMNEDTLCELDEFFDDKSEEIEERIYDLPEVVSYMEGTPAPKIIVKKIIKKDPAKLVKQKLQVSEPKEIKRTITLRSK
jgi:uracil-DNA glycosylase family 4